MRLSIQKLPSSGRKWWYQKKRVPTNIFQGYVLTSETVRRATGYPTMEAARHSYEMAQKMYQLDDEVAKDNEATRAYYKKFAEAEAAKWRTVEERGPDEVTMDNRGNVTKKWTDLEKNPQFK
jgi:hypothetical protein